MGQLLERLYDAHLSVQVPDCLSPRSQVGAGLKSDWSMAVTSMRCSRGGWESLRVDSRV